VLRARPSAPRSATAVLAFVVVTALVLVACGGGGKDRPSLAAGPTTSTAPSTTQTTVRTTCHALGPGDSLTATASAAGQLPIYAAPGAPTPARTMANPQLVNNDPGAPVPLIFLVKDFPVSQNCQWVQVYLPVRPNGSTGWVLASQVNIVNNPYRLEADLGEFDLKVFKDGATIDTIKIGVAKNNTPTPGGVYYLTELLKPPNPDGDYGPYAYGLSGFSNTLTSFNGGPGQLGIHGTNEPQYIGTQVSHGCIRMTNANITKLAHMLPLGTPVQINA
jgi:lipoprotein-anchoring transpeptidase ErfK/SrfK